MVAFSLERAVPVTVPHAGSARWPGEAPLGFAATSSIPFCTGGCPGPALPPATCEERLKGRLGPTGRALSALLALRSPAACHWGPRASVPSLARAGVSWVSRLGAGSSQSLLRDGPLTSSLLPLRTGAVALWGPAVSRCPRTLLSSPSVPTVTTADCAHHSHRPPACSQRSEPTRSLSSSLSWCCGHPLSCHPRLGAVAVPSLVIPVLVLWPSLGSLAAPFPGAWLFLP